MTYRMFDVQGTYRGQLQSAVLCERALVRWMARWTRPGNPGARTAKGVDPGLRGPAPIGGVIVRG